MFNSITEIAQVIETSTKRPYLIGIDGRSGAGKSILSERLNERLPNVVVVHVDDFYQVMLAVARESLDAEQGYYQYFDWNRLRQQVLIPLSIRKMARYQRYDWVKESLAENLEVKPQGIIIVEGVYSIRPELRKYYDLCIWIETSERERLRRQIARGENTIEWIQRWAAAEIFYVENFCPQRFAHMIIAGECSPSAQRGHKN